MRSYLEGKLKTRQRQIMQLIVEGQSMKEIGAVLNISPRTVAYHKYAMMKKLELKRSADLIQFAIMHKAVHLQLLLDQAKARIKTLETKLLTGRL